MTGIRRHAAAVAFFGLLIAFAVAGPWIFELFALLQLSTFSALALATLGLAFVWGSMGILSFGHAAFFGLGAYAYAITVLNLADSTLALPLAILTPALFSLLLGYFLFFGRVGDVYLAVITLCVTLILFSFMNSTSDPSYRIGSAMLGGFNGINGVPPLNWPGEPDAFLSPEAMFRFCFVILALVYGLLYLLRLSAPGRIMVAVRENELRSQLLGYDTRLYKMAGFTVSAAIAGLAGALFTANAGFVGPTVFGLNQASQFLLWVVAGGLGTLAGPLVASFVFQYLANHLGTSQLINTSLVFGAIIIFLVLLMPRGILPAAQAAWVAAMVGRDACRSTSLTPPRHW
ncbi:branched-chain amino acid ABC transporter permease [Rhodoligotrophos defluvii]|uniref:branched-chain amino acid ABC transporter permease n=1 Tax=Rhodoligotrophos defluvii TaxID=2561934 RepID=UPI0010C9E907|nr:branched-chain amino acid ABC transporter permease [Rhodoligotrophos defluvii]